MSNLPPIHFPPPKNKKQREGQAAFVAYINAHPYLRPVAQFIYKSSHERGLDPVYFAALISFESAHGTFQQHPNANPTGHGWAQINPKVYLGKKDPRDGHTITMADLNNAKWNISFGAYLFSGYLKQYGSYEAAYNKGYNNGYTGPSPFATVPKHYVSTAGGTSPQDAASLSVEQSDAKKNLTDPYVTIKNGKLVKTTQQHALKVFGQSVRRSEVISTWQNLNDIYLAYTNKPVTLRAVKDILASGKSKYQIIAILAKGPNFVGSPVWKQNAPGYQAVWSQIYGQNSTPDQKALKYAIVNNLGSEGFAQLIRNRPDYETSQEFKGNEAGLSAVYTKIYGVPDPSGLTTVKQATRQGQSPDEFASWLRSQPEYQYSSEFKSKALGVASALGMVTGQQATLGADLAARSTPPVGTDPNAKPAGVLG